MDELEKTPTWTNMNFKIPPDLKREIKTFCASKNVKMKDFFIYSLKQTLEKYNKQQEEQDESGNDER